MRTWALGGAAGASAVLLGALAHATAGGEVAPLPLVLVAAVGAIVGAAVLEFGLGRWGLVASIALMQVAAHVLIEPVGGHRGGHAHGVAGQVADANASVFVQHLSGSAALMVALHIAAFATIAMLVSVAAPLARLLLRCVEPMRPRALPIWVRAPRLAATAITLRFFHGLDHVVIRRGPPAFV